MATPTNITEVPVPPTLLPKPPTTILNPPTTVLNPPPPPHFTIGDQTTHQLSTSDGSPYTGPDTELKWQYITLSPDNLDVTANVPFVFIHTGSGEDALDVSTVNGNNVLDGGTGSNFLTGGTGHDTFFVDDRNASSDIWSTIKNFHSGDDATIWGVTPQDFFIAQLDNQGAPGATGLTFSITSPGKPNANLTLAGFSKSDLSAGHLTVSFGHTDDMTGLPGSDYMQIHAT